ncbi:hypothetical protein GCM10009785_34950 [Brooklawnia cerclae]
MYVTFLYVTPADNGTACVDRYDSAWRWIVGWNQMGSGMGWGWLFLALLVIGIVVLVVVLMRLLAGGDRGRPRDPRVTGRNPARETLDERYARGEIDAAEYDERRRRLAGDREG